MIWNILINYSLTYYYLIPKITYSCVFIAIKLTSRNLLADMYFLATLIVLYTKIGVYCTVAISYVTNSFIFPQKSGLIYSNRIILLH